MSMSGSTSAATTPARLQMIDALPTLRSRPRGFSYPTNSLAGVLDNPQALRPLLTRLTQLGVAPHRIATLRGAADRRRLEYAPAPGPGGAMRRWLGSLGPEAELFQRYARELEAGHTLLLVHGVRRADADMLCNALTASGGHAVQHYGRLTIAMLAP
jgi:hypothetical protein